MSMCVSVCLKIDRTVVSNYSLYILLESWMKKKNSMASDKRKQAHCFMKGHPSPLASLKATRVWGQRSLYVMFLENTIT